MPGAFGSGLTDPEYDKLGSDLARMERGPLRPRVRSPRFHGLLLFPAPVGYCAAGRVGFAASGNAIDWLGGSGSVRINIESVTNSVVDTVGFRNPCVVTRPAKEWPH
jgi:hypothetical protein